MTDLAKTPLAIFHLNIGCIFRSMGDQNQLIIGVAFFRQADQYLYVYFL